MPVPQSYYSHLLHRRSWPAQNPVRCRYLGGTLDDIPSADTILRKMAQNVEIPVPATLVDSWKSTNLAESLPDSALQQPQKPKSKARRAEQERRREARIEMQEKEARRAAKEQRRLADKQKRDVSRSFALTLSNNDVRTTQTVLPEGAGTSTACCRIGKGALS